MDSLFAKGADPNNVLQEVFLHNDRKDLSIVPEIESIFENLLAHNGTSSTVRLLLASFLGKTEVVQQSADGSEYRNLASVWAIRRGHIAIVKILRPQANDDESVSIEVCRSGNPDLHELFNNHLLRWRLDRSSALHFSTKNSFHGAMKRLIEHGTDPNKDFGDVPDTVPACYLNRYGSCYDFNLWTHFEYGPRTVGTNNAPLAIACNEGDCRALQLLLDHGANVDSVPLSKLLTSKPYWIHEVHSMVQIVRLLL